MLIEKYEYQNIVNKLINILGKNINIMDAMGVIIASGDNSRINTFHEGAKHAADLNKEIIVDESNLNQFSGCKPGVNIPFYYNGTVLGVVGITGASQDVKGYGLIVKELVELMISENERKKEELFQKRAIKNFAKELTKITELDNINDFYDRANLVGFNGSIKRIVIVGEVLDFSSIVKNLGEEGEVKAQILKQEIVDFISEYTANRADIVINIFEHRFVIFKSSDRDIYEYCETLHGKLRDRIGIFMNFALGTDCHCLKDYSKSYDIASNLLEISKKLQIKKPVLTKDDYYLELLLSSLPKEKKLFLSNLVNNIDYLSKEDYKILIETLKALISCNMNLKLASSTLFIHRNTLLYRINKYKDHGIDLMDMNCCFKLSIMNAIRNLQD